MHISPGGAHKTVHFQPPTPHRFWLSRSVVRVCRRFEDLESIKEKAKTMRGSKYNKFYWAVLGQGWCKEKSVTAWDHPEASRGHHAEEEESKRTPWGGGPDQGLRCLDNVSQQHGRESLGPSTPTDSSGSGPYNYKVLSYQWRIVVRWGF